MDMKQDKDFRVLSICPQNNTALCGSDFNTHHLDWPPTIVVGDKTYDWVGKTITPRHLSGDIFSAAEYKHTPVPVPEWAKKEIEGRPTVGDLREALVGLDDSVLIGNSGHFGELLRCQGFEVKTTEVRKGSWRGEGFEVKVLYIDIDDAGPDPD